ncbi:fibronectin type III domain-containing protein [Mangrovimonas xylaniphaga]|uniref:fibronectin type III domain-containing protein n=1 Tax=Mangrovimonas xylaniphaga TaxID=1645915 RepID=UPI0006B6104E|nr:fibronectin type III domain-containing protein [Mangrovimonas xylaniphaga]
MKNFCVFLLYLSVWSAFSQNLHDDANAASILNEANATTGWNSNADITSSLDNPFSGNFSLRVAATGQNSRDMNYTFNAVVGQQYQITIWAREGDFSFSPAFANWTGFQGFATTAITGTVWTEYTWTLTATNSSPLIRVYTAPYSGWQVGHEVFIDNVSILVADSQSPSSPSNLVASNLTSTSLDLGWTASTDNIGVVDYEVFQDGQSIGFSGGDLSFPVGNLAAGTEYSFTIIALDAANNASPASTELLVTTLSAIDITPPTAPTNLVSNNLTATSLDLGWTASTDNVGVVNYEVFQEGQSIGFSDGTPSFSVGNLTEETEYSFTVVAIDEAGNTSPASTELLVTTLPLPDTIAPSSPTGLIASNISTNSFDLTWTASTDDVGVVDYEVFRNGQSIGLSGGGLAFLVGNLTANTEYTITVIAIDAAGNTSPASTELLVTTLESSDVTPPSVPTGLISSNLTANSFDLGWTASTDDVGVVDYEVFRDGQSIGFSEGVLAFSVTGLTPETEYAITVLALDAAGNASASSTELMVTTLSLQDIISPTAPTGLFASNVTTSGFDLGWITSTDNVGVINYEVFQDGQSIGFSSGALSFSIGGLTAETEYGFTVVALDAAGNSSAASSELLVTTSVNSINYTSLNANLDTVDWIGRDLFAARNIGVGTTNTQGYRLAVAGNMIAEEVRVALQASWPDYVFDSTYKLPSLLEVKNHIEEKGHLINVPSKSEVLEQGIGLGEMNAVLLEKIEELTLYILHQEARIQQLEEKVESFKN